MVKRKLKRAAKGNGTGKKPKSGRFKCARCYRFFSSRHALKIHSKQHLKALREIKMLERGEKPEYSKLGQEFKGKNKIIVG